MTVESFAPTIVIDGQTFTPEGWMWVLGLAIAGVPWAVEQAESDDLWEKAKNWERQRKIYQLEKQIQYREQEIFDLMVRKKALQNA